MPPDAYDTEFSGEINGKFHRFELVKNYTEGTIKEGFKLFTWLVPERCNECKEYIDEFQYYYYEKRNFDKKQTVLRRYFCCNNCYEELKATEGYQVATNLIKKKILPLKSRGIFWRNLETMELLPEG
jgi:hypothetical protein